MGTTNDHIDLRHISERLLLLSQVFDIGLQSRSLQINPDVRQMVSSVVNAEPNLTQCTYEVHLWNIRHVYLFSLTVTHFGALQLSESAYRKARVLLTRFHDRDSLPS
jgi:hypothetical protein